MKRIGIISSYHPTKFLGTIVVYNEGEVVERYFFFGSRIVSGPEPTTGAKVRFEVSPKQPKPGQLPSAHQIEVLASAEQQIHQAVEALIAPKASSGVSL